jgi:AraC-like DNA-binding protein
MNASQPSNKDRRLSQIFVDKLVPWTGHPRMSWMVATERRRKLRPCEDVEITPRKIIGKEVAGGGARRYRNSNPKIKSWPEDHLNATRTPKLACILSGCADLQFYDYQLRAPESTFIFIPPGVPQPDGSLRHLNKDNPLQYCDICWMIPRGDKLHFWACRSEKEKHFTLSWSNVLFLSERLNVYLRLLHEEVMTANDTPFSLIPHLLHLLMAGLHREALSGNYLPHGQELHPAWKLQISADPIAQAQEYIDAHYGSVITLEDLARTVGMSRSLFAQRFKQKTGQTMGEYLTACRLRKARDLLEQSEWAVSAISEFVGFRSQNYFYDLFRRHERCSPLEFRNSHQKRSKP